MPYWREEAKLQMHRAALHADAVCQPRHRIAYYLCNKEHCFSWRRGTLNTMASRDFRAWPLLAAETVSTTYALAFLGVSIKRALFARGRRGGAL